MSPLDTLGFAVAIIIILSCGYIIGYMNKGITVNINQKREEAPTEYNESLANELPVEVQEYYKKNNGFNNF